MSDYAKGLVKQYDKNGNMMLDGDEVRELRGRAATADANNDKVVTVDELVARLSGSSTSNASTTSGGATSVSSAATTTKSDAAAATSTSTKASESDSKSGDDRDSDRRDRGGFFGSGRGRDRDRGSESDSKSSSGTSSRVLTWLGAKPGEKEATARRTYRFTPATEKLPTGLPSWFKSQDKNHDGQVSMSEYSRSWSKSTVAKFRSYDLNGDGVVTAKEAATKP